MVFKWNLPATKSFNTTKSGSILSHIIGHEGPNSLLSELIILSLATGLSAGNNRRLNECLDQFVIHLNLTEKGELKYHRVIEVVYMYINKLQQRGIPDYLYKELSDKNQISYDNISK